VNSPKEKWSGLKSIDMIRVVLICASCHSLIIYLLAQQSKQISKRRPTSVAVTLARWLENPWNHHRWILKHYCNIYVT